MFCTLSSQTIMNITSHTLWRVVWEIKFWMVVIKFVNMHLNFVYLFIYSGDGVLPSGSPSKFFFSNNFLNQNVTSSGFVFISNFLICNLCRERERERQRLLLIQLQICWLSIVSPRISKWNTNQPVINYLNQQIF